MLEEDKAKLGELYATISALSVDHLEELMIHTAIAVLTGEISEQQATVIADMVMLNSVERLMAQAAVADGAVVN